MNVVAKPTDTSKRNANIAENLADSVWFERVGQFAIVIRNSLPTLGFYGVDVADNGTNAGRGVQVKKFDPAVDNDKGKSLGRARSRHGLVEIIRQHLDGK